MKKIILGLAVLLLCGCAGKSSFYQLRNSAGGQKEILFPNGTFLGGASTDQAAALAKILVDAHNDQMQEIAALQEQAQSAQQSQSELAQSLENNRITCEQALQLLTQLAEQQGSGEITLFFATGSSKLKQNSLEHNRLIRFLDYVSRESRGRTVHLVLIGSASKTGSPQVNKKLSSKRAQAPISVIDKYLVNVNHDFYQVDGIGDMYSPGHIKLKEHERYQYVRIIAFYQTEQLPSLPDKNLE